MKKLVSKIESQFLFNEKAYAEGKGEIVANQEINRLIVSQKDFKNLWHENNRLKKENEKLIIELNSKDDFKQKFKELKKENKEEHTEKIYSGNILHLRRIINFMEKDKLYSFKSLELELCMGMPNLRGCLDFLKEFKVIDLEFTKEGGVIRK